MLTNNQLNVTEVNEFQLISVLKLKTKING